MTGAGAVDQLYSYVAPSALTQGTMSGRLDLETSSPGSDPHPWLMTASVTDPAAVAAALLSLSTIARTRFYVPPSAIARMLELADPVVTSHGDFVRAEVLSVCAGVYARLDLPPTAFADAAGRRGSTNVDLGQELRRGLRTIAADARLTLSIGSDGVDFEVADRLHVERQVKLPARWVKGFAEVQVVGPRLERRLGLSGGALVELLRRTPAKTRPHDVAWVTAAGRGSRLAARPTATSAPVGGASRLRILEPLAHRIRQVDVYGDDARSAWVCDLGDARFTLVLSPTAARGFSGEGAVLDVLASESSAALAAVVATTTDFDRGLEPGALSARCGLSVEDTGDGLLGLAAAGDIGWDHHDGAWFHRPLPIDAVRAVRHPRLRDAELLVAAGAIRVDGCRTPITAEVTSGGLAHRVSIGVDGDRCTCPWYGQHRGTRGPCKHVLAVRVFLQRPRA